MFEWLESTSVAIWVAESLWGYPVMLSLHAVGLAVVVGIFSMRDMRLLGLFSGIQPAAFLPLSKLAWVGFIVNGVSGTALFTSQAVTFVNSTPFLLKISFIVAGMALAGVIQSRLRGELAGSGGDAVISGSTKLIALISLLFWIAAIIAGRLVAYI
ncbi:MAG: hypothetical protein HQ498_00120 [Pseudohongiella sp.]|jgi:hypothetical protein|nr:hypothetical protein [Pseudohongiella sp.]